MTKLSINSSSAQLFKELSGGHNFTLTDRVDGDFKFINKPRLLTSLMTPAVNTHRSRSFLYDVVPVTAQIPGGKSYSERGPDLKKDKAHQEAFGIPSFGLVYNVLPQDYDGKRVPNGSNSELMTEDYVVGLQQGKALDAFDLLNEVGMATLLVSDANYLAGGPFTAYDYSTVLTGSSRAAATDLLLGSLDVLTTRTTLASKRKLIEQKLGEAGKDASGIVVVCGDVLFGKLWEQQANLGLGRPLLNSLDLASMALPTITDGAFRYDNFDSEAGVTIINYGATIIGGSKMIGDDDGYMFPIGVSNTFTIELAPAMVRGIVNTEAEAMYMFTEAGIRTGVTTEIESNRLFLNRNPELIIELTSST